MSKRNYAIIALVLVIILLGFTFVKPKNKSAPTELKQTEQEFVKPSILNKNPETEQPHDLKLTIISPEGDTFESGQARMYKALFEGNGKYSNSIKCHWAFFLNENNKEVLYKEMENRGLLSGESKEVCAFTSTFIDSRGELRVVLTASIQNPAGEKLETITAERKYTVK